MGNEENEIDLIELLKTLWENRCKLIKYGAIGFCVGVVIAFSIPKVYNTTVKVAPEGSAEPSNLGGMSALAGMAGINLNSDTDGITSVIYPDIVKSSPFLLEFANIQVENNEEKMTFYHYVTEEQKKAWWSYIISAPMKLIGLVRGLFSEKEDENEEINIFRPSFKQEQYIKFLHNNTSIASDKKTNILTISVNTQDALISAIIADSLMSKLQVYMTEYKTNKIRKDLLAKEKMLCEAKLSYYKAEDTLAKGLDNNRNIMTQRGQVKIDRLTNEKDLAFNVYQQLATQVEATKIQLQDKTPIATIIEPANVAIKASSPNKALIAIMFAFLGGIIMAAIILYKNNFFSSVKQD